MSSQRAKGTMDVHLHWNTDAEPDEAGEMPEVNESHLHRTSSGVIFTTKSVTSRAVVGQLPIDSGSALTDEDQIDKANHAMEKYQRYVDELCYRYPETFNNLKRFLEGLSNCRCRNDLKSRDQCKECNCADNCAHSNAKECKCSAHCQHVTGSSCQSGHIRDTEHTVRVYNIYKDKKVWGDFLKVQKYNVSERHGTDDQSALNFEDLKKDLFSGRFPTLQYGEEDESDEPPPVSRLITVSHLSPRIAKLIGGKFNIPADFFNRHLPGTEAISGRLISRLPSSVQIDFSELYETTQTFEELFGEGGLEVQKGHQIIQSMMKQHILFGDVGWNYYPILKEDFDKSIKYSRLSSGVELLTQQEVKNFFQFTLTHRISVYSNPPGHPSTAIIIFYPTLPVCSDVKHYKIKGGTWTHGHKKNNCRFVKFRAIPDTVPDMLSTTFHEEYERMSAAAAAANDAKFSNYNYEQIKKTPYPDGFNNDGNKKNKTDYASAYDRELRVHLWEHLGQHGPWKPVNTIAKMLEDARNNRNHKGIRRTDDATFVHLFGSPLFKLVSANWARLIVRRSFDLDLLEWRPPEQMGSNTVEEVKSRRVAIGSHYRDIDASVEVLSGLTQEERPVSLLHKYGSSLPKDLLELIKLALFETNSQWNRGRSNGFVSGLADNDSWEKVYYDFFELKASIEALSRRADKIQDGIIGLIQVWSGEQSAQLTLIALAFSFIIIPFSIAGTIFGVGLTRELSTENGGYLPPKRWQNFAGAVGGTAAALVFPISSYWFWHKYVSSQFKEKLRREMMLVWLWITQLISHRKAPATREFKEEVTTNGINRANVLDASGLV